MAGVRPKIAEKAAAGVHLAEKACRVHEMAHVDSSGETTIIPEPLEGTASITQ